MKARLMLILFLVVALVTAAMASDIRQPANPVPVFNWDPWKAAVSPDGTVQNLFISYDEREEMDVLLRIGRELEERRRKEHGIEPNDWKVIGCFTTDIDMVFVDEDGTRFHEKGGLSPEDKDWVRKNYQQYKDAAYAFSRGSVIINATERYLEEPFVGEYSGRTSFWMSGWPDLGAGLHPYDFDSVTGIWYEGPCRPWSRGAYLGGNNWVKRLGHSNAQFARGREVGGTIGDISKITRHEWGHGVSTFIRRCGYIGLPTQYTPGNFHHGAHLFFFRSILAPAHWRKMRMQGPWGSPANRPNDRYLGFCDTWLAAGPFDLPEDNRSTAAGIPHPRALDFDFVPADVIPDADMDVSGRKWLSLTNDWEQNGPDVRSALPSPHVDTIVYAHTYVLSPDDREVLMWAGCTQPTQILLNGTPALRFWRGGFEDGAMRRVILKKGWNRVMYKILDQGEDGMGITLRFTDLERNVLTDLQYSGSKPEGEIAQTAAPLPPLEVKKHAWDWPINDDWFGRLPILTEEHLDKILGAKGVRIVGAPTKWSDRGLPWQERRWTLIDLSNIDGDTKILSRVVPWDSLKTTLENTLLLDNLLVMSRELGNGQRSYESMGLVRYQKSDGKTGDLVFLRADVVEMFLDTARRPKDTPEDFHAGNVVGYILRDSKNCIVLDTDLGGDIPVNEFDMLVAKKDCMELEASPSVSRVLRGDPASLNLTARWAGDKPVKARAVIKRFDTGDIVLNRDLGEMGPGSEVTISHPLDTGRMKGLVNFIASIEFGNGQTVERPVPLPVFDPVNVSVRVEGTGILQVSRQTVRVALSSNLESGISGRVSLDLPKGWRSKPQSVGFELPALDTRTELSFEVTIPKYVESGWCEIGATAKVKGLKLVSEGSVPVMASMGDVLVDEDFEDGIGGSFSFTNAMYQVTADVTGPKNGQKCLHISDRGGSHYGHVHMFGPGERPAQPPADMTYSYDTKLYPWMEFWMKTAARDINLGLQVVLDDGDTGYGVLINGFWEQQHLPRMLIGRVQGFEPDGNWQLVRVNLDELLDGVLGETSHFVTAVQLGDTRGFASGWAWSFDYKHHHIDDFRIYREKAPAKLLHVEKTREGLPRYSRTHRVPAFSSESADGIRLTIRTDRLEYNPWHQMQLNLWVTNDSENSISIPVEPWKRLWSVRITDETGSVLGGEWAYFGSEEKEKENIFKAENYRELKPGENYSRRIRLNELIQGWKERNDVTLEDGGNYSIEAKLLYRRPEDSEEPENLFAGPAISNAMRFALADMPTVEEELEALKTSLSAVRRSRSAAQLGKAKFEDAISSLVEAVGDTDDNVRLNAVWALGNMPRMDPEDAAQAEYIEKMKPAVAELQKALDDKNWRVGEYAAQALANLNAREALNDIIARAKSESAWIRRRTADALKTMADPAAIATLSDLMEDRSRSTREAALGALISLADKYKDAAIKEADPDHETAKQTFLAAWQGVSKGLDDEYFFIRRNVVNNAKKYKALVDVREIVIKALDDPDDWVREAGIRALPELEEQVPGIEEKLVDFMDDYWQNVRKAALEVYPKVVGKSVEDGTGKSFGHWMRKHPRPGDTWEE